MNKAAIVIEKVFNTHYITKPFIYEKDINVLLKLVNFIIKSLNFNKTVVIMIIYCTYYARDRF